ncbi:sugar phosphate isomerase/epimerase family protein [Aquibacillus salsiterrae]|uniref:Sugar phosphate isomerase/epimerase n=1 Tax=Aquibacillus salsiterrae TaxID=2950439 RepID=A0A9X4AFA2_9BACI|nr:sugar phosphate isomerase/epimerase family protein [Aquibacillus salsiterrae]MDC3416035.1 sugar phosphate isomerase/epimerase [Aquibacillus salsiterrae]
MKFSVFTVMAPDTTPKELVSLLKETGYDGVEWRFKETPEYLKLEEPSYWGNNLCTISPSINDEELSDLAAYTKEKGIEITSVTPYLTAGDLESTEQVLRVAKKLGASTIRVGVPKYDRSENYNDLFNLAVSYLGNVEEMCKRYNIKGLVETHHMTITPSASLAHRLVSQFDPNHIGVLYDPGNMVHEGYENYRMGMELLGPYLAHVHIKNAIWQVTKENEDGTTDWEVKWAPIEKGAVDWRQVFQDLKAVGYDGYVGMEDFSNVYPTKESLKHNKEWVKKLLNAELV